MTAPTGPDRTGVVARLDALEAAHKGATPGPWIADSTEIYQEWPGIPGLSGDWIGETCRIEGDPLHATAAADAAAIVAEHNAMPALLAAVRGVLDRHHRIGEGEPGREVDYCDYDGFVWPCAEYRDLAAALGEA